MYIKAVIFINLLLLASAAFRFTNFKCIAIDKSFATIPVCKLKVIQRGVVAMDLHLKLLQSQVNNVTVQAELFKKSNGFKLYHYNISANVCKVLRDSKKYPFLGIFVVLLARHSNVNHTCPYSNDIIINHLILKDEFFNYIPLPQGDYMLNAKVAAYNDWKLCVKTYFTVS